MNKDLNQAISLIQRMLRMASITGTTKHTRYLRTALVNLKTYQLQLKGQENGNDDERRSSKAT